MFKNVVPVVPPMASEALVPLVPLPTVLPTSLAKIFQTRSIVCNILQSSFDIDPHIDCVMAIMSVTSVSVSVSVRAGTDSGHLKHSRVHSPLPDLHLLLRLLMLLMFALRTTC